MDVVPFETKNVDQYQRKIEDTTCTDPVILTSTVFQEQFLYWTSWHTSRVICAPFPIFNRYSQLFFFFFFFTSISQATMVSLWSSLADPSHRHNFSRRYCYITQQWAAALTSLRDALLSTMTSCYWLQVWHCWVKKVIKQIEVSFKGSPLASYISQHTLSPSLPLSLPHASFKMKADRKPSETTMT